MYNVCTICKWKERIYMRIRMNISLDPETAEQLKKVSEQSHMNMSQWITQAIWKSSNKDTQRKRKVKYNG